MSSYHPKKRLGQHFLVSDEIIGRIIELIRPDSCPAIIEVGPGRGALTIPLAKSGVSLTAVEFDRDMVSYLEGEIGDLPNVSIINRDFVTFDPVCVETDRFVLAGNLPYNITSPVLDWATRHHDRIERGVLMVQEEVARRLTAKPGCKDWSPISIFAQLYFDLTFCFRVSADCFRPAPKVSSAVVELVRREPVEVGDFGRFERLVRASFAQRRKMLINNLVPHIVVDRAEAVAVLSESGLAENCRAEELTIESFILLAARLSDRL